MDWYWPVRKQGYVNAASVKREHEIKCDICAQREAVATLGKGLLCDACWEAICRVASCSGLKSMVAGGEPE